MITFKQGTEEIFRRAGLAWQEAHLQVTGKPAPVASCAGNGVERPNLLDIPWCYVEVKSVGGDRRGVSEADTHGNVRYENFGVIIIQVFAPRSGASGKQLARDLADQVRNRFRGHITQGGVAFYEARIDDSIPPEANWWQVNAIAEWEFDEMRSE